MPRDPIEQVILRRGSSRKFARTPITLAQMSTILDRAARGVPADFLDPAGSQLNHLYLIVHAVEGLEPGAYVFHRGRGVLECLKPGDFRDQAGYLGVQQALPAEAASMSSFSPTYASSCSAMAIAAIAPCNLKPGSSAASSIWRPTRNTWAPLV